jgi:hypothetical protein
MASYKHAEMYHRIKHKSSYLSGIIRMQLQDIEMARLRRPRRKRRISDSKV